MSVRFRAWCCRFAAFAHAGRLQQAIGHRAGPSAGNWFSADLILHGFGRSLHAGR